MNTVQKHHNHWLSSACVTTEWNDGQACTVLKHDIFAAGTSRMLLLDVGLKQCEASEDNGWKTLSVCVCLYSSYVHVYTWVYLCMFESVLHCVGVLAAKTVCTTMCVMCICVLYVCVCVCMLAHNSTCATLQTCYSHIPFT